MDKNLKKLNRVELLQVMVRLSERNDALEAENAQLKRALAEKPRMQRTAKVGSLAELAMQANGYFESAQRSADMYLREIKRMRDQLAARVAANQATMTDSQLPQIGPAVDGVVRDADAQAQAIVNRATSQAESIVVNARAKAESMIADADRQSRAMVSRANRQAKAVVHAARQEAAERTSEERPRQRTAAAGAAHAAASAGKPGLSMPIRGRHVRLAGNEG